MPAIQLARLKIQAAQLVEDYHDTASYVKGLHGLFDYYADRTRRSGQSGEPPPLITSYNVPLPVLRQVLIELAPHVALDHQAAFSLCNSLWEEPYLEFRLLAASILGQIPPNPPEPILDRVLSWAIPSTEDRLLDALIGEGLSRVRKESPDSFLNQVEGWLTAAEVFPQQLGLRATHTLVSDRYFKNLPFLFRMMAPLVRKASPQLRPYLLDVLRALAMRSPKEAAFFLRKNLSVKTDNPGTAWLTRNSLRYFPAEEQARLRVALREEV